MHLYPMEHVEETIDAKNEALDVDGHRHMTKQEFFQLQGIMFALSLFPNFAVRDLFSKSAEVRKSEFIGALPDFSKYMRYRR